MGFTLLNEQNDIPGYVAVSGKGGTPGRPSAPQSTQPFITPEPDPVMAWADCRKITQDVIRGKNRKTGKPQLELVSTTSIEAHDGILSRTTIGANGSTLEDTRLVLFPDGPDAQGNLGVGRQDVLTPRSRNGLTLTVGGHRYHALDATQQALFKEEVVGALGPECYRPTPVYLRDVPSSRSQLFLH